MVQSAFLEDHLKSFVCVDLTIVIVLKYELVIVPRDATKKL